MVAPDAPSVTNSELLRASGSSPFQRHKFIHLVFCYSVLHHRVVIKGEKGTCVRDLWGLLTSDPSRWSFPGGRKEEQKQWMSRRWSSSATGSCSACVNNLFDLPQTFSSSDCINWKSDSVESTEPVHLYCIMCATTSGFTLTEVFVT